MLLMYHRQTFVQERGVHVLTPTGEQRLDTAWLKAIKASISLILSDTEKCQETGRENLTRF